jgi:hypothetical protein
MVGHERAACYRSCLIIRAFLTSRFGLPVIMVLLDIEEQKV